MLFVGGLIVVVFATALIGPYFINWNNYKSTFEAEAARILGQPVRIADNGTADASLLPSPSLTFTNVEIGDREGKPMMTVERFTATLGLMPLLQGEIHIESMQLEKPRITVAMDDAGMIDWSIRNDASKAYAPDGVSFDNVEITDGTFVYDDAAGNVRHEFQLDHVVLSSPSLAGPWRAEGTYREDGSGPGQFQVSTGRQAADGSLRVKAEVTPPDVPLSLSADGTITSADDGLAWAGTFATEFVDTESRGDDSGAGGWRTEGSFTLKRKRLVIDRAVLSIGSEIQPVSLAGSLVVDLGSEQKFRGSLQAKQLDLDRLFGRGPGNPIPVDEAAGRIVAWLGGLPALSMPGAVGFSVDGVVVGGSVLQNVKFQATSAPGGWQLDAVQAKLPGQASLEASGLLATGDHVGFSGRIKLDVAQPASFAAWWRGRRDQVAIRLPPFDLAGNTRIEAGRVAVNSLDARIGTATITGGFSWTAANDDHRRSLQANLTADRVDYAQIKGIAELLAGQKFEDVGVIADSYIIALKADELAVDDITVRGVTVDASYADGTVSVKKINVDDIGGAQFQVTSGSIANIFDENPQGNLTARLRATDLNGLARFVDRLAPGSGIGRWLSEASPSLVPVTLDVNVEAPARDGGASYRLKVVDGAFAQTTVNDFTLDFTGRPADWRSGKADLHVRLSSVNAMNFARQIGLTPIEIERPGTPQLTIDASGVPATGMATKVDAGFAGLELHSEGTFTLAPGLPAAYAGSYGLTASDLDPLIAMAGLHIPGGALGTPLALKGQVATASNDVSFDESSVAGHSFRGTAKVFRQPDGLWAFAGGLSVDEVDLDWVAALGLGFAPVPTGDPAAPWSKTPFSGPTFGRVAIDLNLSAGRVDLAEGLTVTKAQLGMKLAPDRVELEIRDGQLAGGTISAHAAIRNVDGDAGLTGDFDLKSANLATFMWMRNERPVAIGTLDLSADFEATGRSPAGLVGTLTGSGALTIRDGEARNLNPQAAAVIVRGLRDDETIDEATLLTRFATYIDGNPLPFGDTTGAFSIAGGVVRLKNLTLAAGKAQVVGGGSIDLSAMTLDSDWTMNLDPGDEESRHGSPQIGLVFSGPVASPTRSFDVLQFASYLNILQTERMQAKLILEQDARTEKDRLLREKRKLREDAERRDREAKAEAARRFAIFDAIGNFHEEREISTAEKAESEAEAERARIAAALKNAVDRALAEKADADRRAVIAASRLDSARTAVTAADAAVVDTKEDEAAAVEQVVVSGREAEEAKAAAAEAASKAEAARGVAADARATFDARTGESAAAKAAADKAQSDRATATALARSAADAVSAAQAALKKANVESATANATLAAATRAASDAESAKNESLELAARKVIDRDGAEKAVADAAAVLATATGAAEAAAREVETAEAAAKDAASQTAVAASAALDLERIAATAKSEAARAADAASAAARRIDETAAAAAAAADRIGPTHDAAQISAAAAPGAAADAKAKRDAVAPLAERASAARAASEAADQTATEASAEARRLQVAASAAEDEAKAKAATVKQFADAVATARAAYMQAEQATLDADDAAKAVADRATEAAKARTEARETANAATGADRDGKLAAADEAERAATEATNAVLTAKISFETARVDSEQLGAALKDAEAAAAGPAGAADEAAKDAADARRDADAALERAKAAKADADAKRGALAAAEAAVERARAEADAAVKASANATIRAAADAKAAADAVTGKRVADEAARAAISAKADADKVAAAKAPAAAAASESAVSARVIADRLALDSAGRDSLAKDAGARATEAASSMEVARAAKARADEVLADAEAAVPVSADAAETRAAAADKATADRAAAEVAAKAAAAVVAAAKADLDTALRGKANADDAVNNAAATATAAAAAVKAIAAAPGKADAAARRAENEAEELAGLGVKAAQDATDAASAAHAADAALEKARSDRATAEAAAASALAAVPVAEAAAKAAADFAGEKAAAVVKASQPQLVANTPLPPTKPVAPPEVTVPEPEGEIVAEPVKGPLPPLPKRRPDRKPAPRINAPLVISPPFN